MSINPITASKEISERYLRYIKTTFFIKDKEYMEQFSKLLHSDSSFFKGPYLDFTDSFELGKSIKELVDDKVLNKEFLSLYRDKQDILNRSLYKHQELSIKRLNENHNLIVTTGTGSGKTESFLIPIINHLMKQKQKGQLSSGVRALIIYPMNALANDQMKRMRDLLSSYCDITFGSYTGETEEKEDAALRKFKNLNNCSPRSNEIISREKMKENPPHILITNYAMLEYLMLRPKDNVFFNGEGSNNWKYIVLDEAHTYKGATGIEVSILIRRLVKLLENKEKINFILTSATLGGEQSNKEIIDFASRLCSDFEFTNSDIIRAFRINYCNMNELRNHNIEIYSRLKTLVNSTKDIDKFYSLFDEFSIDYDKNENDISSLLFDFVKKDVLYFKLRNLLKESPRTIEEISSILQINSSTIVDFVFLASKANKKSVALLDARYHMFIRSLEGAFITLGNKKLLTLQPTNSIIVDKEEYLAFNINVCKYCGRIYLVGKKEGNKFTQIKESRMEFKQNYFMLLGDGEKISDDEDLEKEEYVEYSLCGKCGNITQKNVINAKKCSCGEKYRVNIVEIKNQKEGLHKCLSCGVQNTSTTVLRGFYLGQEAAASVVASSLYSVIPSSEKIIKKVDNSNNYSSFFGTPIDLDSEKIEEIKKEKQFLVFSDSRQQAAYFASYLDFTYNNILKRRMLIQALKNIEKYNKEDFIEISSVIKELSSLYNNYNICEDLSEATKLAWKTLLYEISTYDRNSLENLGLVSFEFKEKDYSSFGDFKNQDALTLQRVLANSFKKGCIFYHPLFDRMNNEDKEYYLFNGIQTFMVLQNDKIDKSYKKNKRNWIPSLTSNSRFDYISKILESEDKQKITDYLKSFWNGILEKEKYLKNFSEGYLLDIDKMKVRTSFSNNIDWYRCNKCGKLTPNNINNVCPVYRCDGKLIKVDVEKQLKDNHYRQMYLNMKIESMVVKEHTAQLNPNTAKEYQEKFIKKEINVLSSSTTFEMGVDVGSLETVFMKNMPPSPSNYIQRAGRAGRRSDSVAYALTYCKLASHDLTFFQNPIKMIRGQISPPKFKIGNEKIIKRHVNAAIIASFWKINPSLYQDVQIFFKEENFENLINYIKNLPPFVLNYIKSFTPSIYKNNVINWIDNFGGEKGLLKKEFTLYKEEIDELKKYRKDVNKKLKKEPEERKGYLLDSITRNINRIDSENILTFLSRKNIIPKYGFPIDTVELISSLSFLDRRNRNSRLRLQRDLRIAISEYAPDSEIIADGKIYKSKYIKKPSNKNLIWQLYDYSICTNPHCNHMNLRRHILAKGAKGECEICGNKISYNNTFIIPEYGFVIDPIVKKATTKKPDKTYSGEIYYLGNKKDLKEDSIKEFSINNKFITIKSTTDDELVVINKSKFLVCNTCGYSIKDEKCFEKFKIMKNHHKTPYGRDCSNLKLEKRSLGHIFKTDVSYISFNQFIDTDIAYSVLYALLEGISSYLKIERNDISGTLYYVKDDENNWNCDFILFDNVPGGAGHVRRIGKSSKSEFISMLKSSYDVVNNCTCGKDNGGDSACYSCLCNYYNQKQHDILKRRYAIDFLKRFLD